MTDTHLQKAIADLLSARRALTRHLAAHVSHDTTTIWTHLATGLRLAGEALTRSTGEGATVFSALDELDTALYEICEGLGRPAPPTHLPSVDGDPIAVRPTDEVSWSDDYLSWVVHYRTDDSRVPSEFQSWRAVWESGAWAAVEV